MNLSAKSSLFCLVAMLAISALIPGCSHRGRPRYKPIEPSSPVHTFGGGEFKVIPGTLSVDRRLNAVKSDDGKVKILSLDDNSVVSELENSGLIDTDFHRFGNCVLSPDNKIFISRKYLEWQDEAQRAYHENYEIGFWSVESGKLNTSLPVAGNLNPWFQYSDDGSVLAMIRNRDKDYKRIVNIWSALTGKHMSSIAIPSDSIGYFRERAPLLSPNGKYLAASDENIYIWSTDTGELTLTLRPDRDYSNLSAMTFAPDSLSLVHIHYGGYVYRHSLETGILITEFTYLSEGEFYGSHDLESIAISGDGRTLALGFMPHGNFVSYDGVLDTVRFYSLIDGTEIGRKYLPCVGVQSLSFACDDKYLLSCGYDGILRTWVVPSVDNPQDLEQYNIPSEFSYNEKNEPIVWESIIDESIRTIYPEASVSSLLISPNGKYFACMGYGSDEIPVYDLASGTLLFKLPCFNRESSSIAFHPRSDIAAIPVAYSEIALYSLKTGNEIKRLNTERGGYSAKFVSYTPDGRYLVFASVGGDVVFWSVETNKLVRKCQVGYRANNPEIKFSQDGRYFIARTSCGSIIYRTSDLKVIKYPVKPTCQTIWYTEFSPNGKDVAILKKESVLTVYDLGTMNEKNSFSYQTTNPYTFSYTKDGNAFIVRGLSTFFSLMSVDDGSIIKTFEGNIKRPSDLAMTPDGKLIISLEYAGPLKYWLVDENNPPYFLNFSEKPKTQDNDTEETDGLFNGWNYKIDNT